MPIIPPKKEPAVTASSSYAVSPHTRLGDIVVPLVLAFHAMLEIIKPTASIYDKTTHPDPLNPSVSRLR